MVDIVERIDAERTARASDFMRLANPLLREAKAEIELLRVALSGLTDAVFEAGLTTPVMDAWLTAKRALGRSI